ncbi:hypothetical protein AB1K70_20965 [Bremerella sp. JC770]|uniref:hypothetical protein n=1 Tax=Bremerella sp. JC770 TaxID=3232137 RepID=UPI003458F5B0
MMSRMLVAARLLTLSVLTTLVCCGSAVHAEEPAVRTADHQKFAEDFWTYLKDKYGDWKPLETYPGEAPMPEAGTQGVVFVNDIAAKDLSQLDFGSIVVVQHSRDDQPFAVSALFRARPGVNPKKDDWYEMYFLTDGTLVKSSADQAAFNRRGFVTKVVDGRLWVLALDSPSVAELVAGEGPEKHVTLPGAGPDRKTLKSDSRETALRYLFSKPGFATHFEDGRAWIFAKDTDAAKQFAAEGLPEKHVTRVGAGPMRTTIKAPDTETIDLFLGQSNP